MAQKKLHNGAFGNFKPGVANGHFGRKTAAACRRAKYWLGYKRARCTGTYGKELEHWLSSYGHLPEQMRARRRKRINRRRRLVLARLRRRLQHNVFTLALHEVGTTEMPFGSNMQKYGAWYGMNGVAWCAEFVSWCYSHSGRELKFAYVPYMVNAARAGQQGLRTTGDPVQGDIVCFDWEGNGVADHTGLFDRWISRSAGTFATIEGNTSLTNQSNGGQVMRRERSTWMVAAFIKVSR